MKHRIRIDGIEQTCDVTGSGSRFEVTIGGERLSVQVDACGCLGDFRVAVNGQPLGLRLGGGEARALLEGRPVVQDVEGRERVLSRQADEAGRAEAPGRGRERHASGDLKAMMPGVIVRTLVAPGDAVAKGQVVVVLEAMKMENELKAPVVGIVSEVPVTAGQSVAKGQLLARIEEAREPRDSGVLPTRPVTPPASR